jgi:alcohol dehydrogenase (quinone), cytochrome c subunit
MNLRTTLPIAACLAACFALLHSSGKPAAAAQTPASLYVDKCGICHETNGEGTPGTFPPLAGNPHVTASDPSSVIAIILDGMNADVTVRGHTYGGGMPAWGNWLSNADVAAIATYIRTAWGNDASPVTEAQVARVRK